TPADKCSGIGQGTATGEPQPLFMVIIAILHCKLAPTAPKCVLIFRYKPLLMMQSLRSVWPFLSLLLLLLACQISIADNDLTAERTFSTGANPLTGYSEEPPEFLPVTEAYPFQAFIDSGELVLHWDIEP